jgi:PAS domain S-box-containing protein
MPHSQLLEALPDAAILTDSSGVVRGWNDSATQLFGWTASEMIGIPLVERFPLNSRVEVNEVLKEVAAGGASGLS